MSSPQTTSAQDQYEVSQYDGPRTPKRTPMACQFCRGRKLKCDGIRPSCANCHRRGYPCSYTPVSGPGGK
ncbi:hypothetical protein GALMADRAFT_138410 [Galerina marginata CBS 339.88]|uniref:Zn(2)-C6 fungal-type domain-containing protein n=1 Tax=Galerina marginata (strain CBS 339.88) TaxID=685588 RepID=A0A067TH39_GALM3|nr:hypothetical protein GALMADRAFT_138410 [Galerina marginata CBS 339.88]